MVDNLAENKSRAENFEPLMVAKWRGGVSRLSLTKSPIPKPKCDHAAYKAHEIGIEYPAEVLHSYAIFGNHYPCDRPINPELGVTGIN